MGVYEDKRAELEAAAEGGMEGRSAYREGRERMLTDQQAAIDAAMAGPTRLTGATREALDQIISPYGQTAAARMDFSADRFGGYSPQSALDTYSSASDAAIQAAYDRAFSDAQEAAAAARAGGGGGGGGSGDFTRAQLEDLAYGLGITAREQDAQNLAAQNQMGLNQSYWSAANQANPTGDPLLGGALLNNIFVESDTEEDRLRALREVAELSMQIQESQRRLADDRPMLQQFFDRIGSAADQVSAPFQPYRRDPSEEYLRRLIDDQAAAEGLFAENNRYLDQLSGGMFDDTYQARAYEQLGIGPYEMGMGVFRDNPSAEIGDYNARRDQQYLLDYGMTYDEYLAAEQDERDQANEDLDREIAANAGLSPKVLADTLEDLPVPAVEVYRQLDDPTVAQLVSNAVREAVAGDQFGSDPEEVAYRIVMDSAEGLEGRDLDYLQALAVIAAEQAKAMRPGR